VSQGGSMAQAAFPMTPRSTIAMVNRFMCPTT
jgi:hypothetical protein